MKTMLEYQKLILEKVSFDKNIFRRELQKSYRWLQEDEFVKLIKWVCSKFGLTHGDVIDYTVQLALIPHEKPESLPGN